MVCCLAVDPAYRKRGIASLLLREAIDKLDRDKDITVSTFRENGNQEKTLEQILEELKNKGLLTEKEVGEIINSETKTITIGSRTISFDIENSDIDDTGIWDKTNMKVIKIGDYVDYNPTQRVSEKNKSKLTYVSPVGTASSHGTLEAIGKCRGDKKLLVKLQALLDDAGYEGGKLRICHVENEALADKIADMIKQAYGATDVCVYKAGGLCSYYAERGGIILSCETK